MSNDVTSPGRTDLAATAGDNDASAITADEVKRLEAELSRCRQALESIRDRRFEQATSPRLIDQLWHFVRWSKSVAREALEGSRDNDNAGSGSRRR